MALVDPERLLPRPEPVDRRLLERASKPGRVRGIGVDAWRRVLAEPERAGGHLSLALREARPLHSNERRFVADALYGLVRWHRWVWERTGTRAPDASWDAWLTLCGLDPPPDGVDAAALRAPWVPSGDDVADLALLGSIDAAFARALLASVADPVGFLAASNARAPLVLRANRARIDRESLARRLAQEGLPTRPCGAAPDGLVALRPIDVHVLASWREGLCEVQDEGSQRVGALCEGPGHVIDLCAGGGGKSLQLASGGAEVLACDVRAAALRELEGRARRARARVRTMRLDDRGVPSQTADRVLVDAPCTGSGTLRRHPELRFRIDAGEIATRTEVQHALLGRAATCVRGGGALVYAVCSVLRAEGEHVVRSFLDERPAWRHEQTLRLSPDIDGCDGFFGAVLRAPAG